MGARYVDVRIIADEKGQIYLGHTFISQTLFQDVLKNINDFMTANPGEILIVDIESDYDPTGT